MCTLIILCIFFMFPRNVERQHILKADPIIIEGMSFIITPWSLSVDQAKAQVLSIPLWAHFCSSSHAWAKLALLVQLVK